MITLEIRGELGMARRVVEEKGVTFPVLLDSGGFARGELFVTSTPTTFVVDREGRIRSRIVGAVENLEEIVERISSRL